MKRRRLVSLLVTTALPASGCLDRSGTGGRETPTQTADRSNSATTTPTQQGTASPIGTPTSTLSIGETFASADNSRVTVREIQIRKLVRSTAAGGSATHIDVACTDGYQYVVVDADADDRSVLSDGRLGLVVDGTRYPEAGQHPIEAIPPGSNDRVGRPAIPVPVRNASEASVVLFRDDRPRVRWTLPSKELDLISRSPAFRVSSFESPDAVERGVSFDATVTVENTGDRDGRFVAELGAGPVSDYGEVVVEVPAGSERTHTESLRPYYPDSVEEVEAVLDWGCGRLTRTVDVTG